MLRCFDGKPCPGCNETFGHECAYIFNALNRLDRRENKIMEHLVELHRYPETLSAPEIPHPAVDAYIELYRRLREILPLIQLTHGGTRIEWSPGTWACLERLGPFWKQTMHEVDELIEAHNADLRHCRGEINVLKEARGTHHDHWGLRGDTAYDYFVRPVEQGEGGDIRHVSCGQRFVIADHFKERLRADPTWYGKFDCRSCGSYGVPFSEVELLKPLRSEVRA